MNFNDFDISIFLNSEYKEDAVREDIVSPLLRRLGYSHQGKNIMVRSRSLTHPYVYIGTKKHKVNIIPDYLLEIDDKPKWILDAKSPIQDITSGKNVEQAFSYAIHPDVRVDLYALCNGKELTVFAINKIKPILHIKLEEWERNWDKINKVLSPIARTTPHLLDFKPDYGLYQLKAGSPIKQKHSFYPMGIQALTKIEDSLYTNMVNISAGGIELATSFDFDTKRYKQLLRLLPKNISAEIKHALTRQPYRIIFKPEEAPKVNIHAELRGIIHSNKDEDYSPLWVRGFSKF